MSNYNPFSLEGKTILVTGASSGIGRATAIECSKLGATVIITARNEERLNETFQALEGDKKHLQFLADLTVDEDLQKLVEQLPRLDGMSCNAGIGKTKPISFVSYKDFEQVFQTNLIAPVFLTKLVVRKKKLNRPSSIVYTASIGGVFLHNKGNSVYGTSKSALDSFMQYAAHEYAEKEIRCNCVNPGMIETPLIHRGELTNEQLELDAQSYPLKRYGNPQEIAWAIVYLLSNASAWVTGTSLKIDGGFSL